MSGLGDAERLRRGALRFLVGDHALLGQHAQHEVAAGQRAIGVAPRVVVRGSADDRHHRRDFRKAELRQRLAEVELAREPEAVDRARAVLPEIDLVDVGVHDVRLLEATLENDGHHRFLGLAPQRAPAVEEVALHQLLGQRAAALLDLPGAHVDEHRAQDRQRIDAVVAVELAVLDRLERRGQQRRDLVRGDDDPVLAVQREDAADQQRVEADDRNVRALRIGERGDRVAGEADPQRARGLRLVRVAKGPQVQVHAIAATAVRARPFGRRLRQVAEPLELLDEPRGRQRLSDVELDRLRVDACRQRPAPSLELLRDAMPEDQHATTATSSSSSVSSTKPRCTLRRVFTESFLRAITCARTAA